MPYIGPPMPNSYTASSPAKDNANVERVGPAIIFLSSFTTREEWDNIMATNKLGVALTGSAAMGKIGSIIGLMDIGECEHSYLFRVSLPGVSRDESEFLYPFVIVYNVWRNVTITYSISIERFRACLSPPYKLSACLDEPFCYIYLPRTLYFMLVIKSIEFHVTDRNLFNHLDPMFVYVIFVYE